MTYRNDKESHYYKCRNKNIRMSKITALYSINLSVVFVLYIVLCFVILTGYYSVNDIYKGHVIILS